MSLATQEPGPSPFGSEPVVPGRLGDAIRRRHAAPGDLGDLDRTVLAAASLRLARRRSMLLVIRAGTGLAAAAALAIAVWGGWSALRGPAAAGVNRSTSSLALDPKKHVTIIDAFTLARLLEARKPGDPELSSTWDVNHDGRVDQQDVDLLARQAVRLVTAAIPARGGAGGGT